MVPVMEEAPQMTALRRTETVGPRRIAARKAEWLPALEQELKSRVGWADEAISPFAASQRSRPARKLRQQSAPKLAAAS
jgi:hypothetical protein